MGNLLEEVMLEDALPLLNTETGAGLSLSMSESMDEVVRDDEFKPTT